MRSLLLSWVLVVGGLIGPTLTMAQGGADRPSLMSDLCGCLSAIDLLQSDASVERGVHDCLEYAVVMHPREVRTLLDASHASGSKAFQLGSLLGGNLERACEPFRVVKARLQQMPPRKQGT